MGPRVRMTLDLSERINDQIEGLAGHFQTSKADIVRFAIEYLAAGLRAQADGFHVGAWKIDDGVRVEREFIGLPLSAQVTNKERL